MRTRIFLDFWNFQLNWNERTGHAKIDWLAVPRVLIAEAQRTITTAGLTTTLDYEETRVYASYNADSEKEKKLRGWLTSWLHSQAGFNVYTRERRSKLKPVYCRNCKEEIENCPLCNKPFSGAAEKCVDAAICTDLLSLAWENAYEVAILLSADSDFIPAVEKLQEKNYKVINARWHGDGNQLAATCWSNFEIDPVVDRMKRS